MSVFLFVTANEHEREAFESKFIKHKESYILSKTFYLGEFGCYPAAYIHIEEQGFTNPAAVPLVGELVRELQPVAVVMVGIAFGADENKQKIGDVIVSDKILPYDSAKLLEEKTIYKETSKEVGFQLLNAFRDYRDWDYVLPNSMQSVVHIGSVLTGSKLINNYNFRLQLLRDFADNNPIGGEMEAQGIYYVSRLHGVSEWIIIKGICDWGYQKDNPNKEIDQEIAANAAINYCHHVFSRTGVFDSLAPPNQRKNNNLAYLFKNSIVFIDTCSCLHEQFPVFIKKAIPHILKNQTKLYIAYKCLEELIKKTQGLSISLETQTALSIINKLKYEGLIEIRGNPSDCFENGNILQSLIRYKNQYNIVLITQDENIAIDALLLNNTISVKNNEHKIMIKKINKKGNLTDI